MPVDPTNHSTPTHSTPTSTDSANSALSSLFRTSEPPALSRLDADDVIRRSRRRRLPRRIGVGSLVSLAVVGIGVAGITSAGGFAPGGTTSADSSSISGSAESAEAFDNGTMDYGSTNPEDSAGISRAPADKINLCGGALAEVAPSASGLQLTVEFADAAVGSTSVMGTATLTNTGTAPVSGYSGATPAITLSQDGIVTWHSNGPTIMSIVDVALAPGESMTYAASFTPVVCAVEDDLGESFRDTLPAASPGEYQLSAALDVFGDNGTELVTGPATTITLR
jgi:hypothetical protein